MFTLSVFALPLRFTLSGTLLTGSVSVLAAGDAVRGQAWHVTHGTACHALDRNGVGPAHRGVPADPAFDCSPARGVSVRDPAARADLIADLRSLRNP